MGISVEVNVGERVENPQQDAGWLQTSLNVGEGSVGISVGVSVEVIVGVNVGERVANPQQDAGWLQTSLNVGEGSVEVSVGVSVEVIVGSSWKSAQVGVGRVCVWSLAVPRSGGFATRQLPWPGL